MRRVGIAALVLALLAASGPVLAGSCDLQRIASLDAVRTPDGLLAIPVSADGQSVSMLLDTGAERGVIDIAVARKLGLTPLKIYSRPPQFNVPGAPFLSIIQYSAPDFYLANGMRLDHFVRLPSLDIGASRTRTVTFLLAHFDAATVHGLNGILGSNVLRNFDVEVNPAAAKVNLFSPKHCQGKVVYWAPAFAALPVRVTPNGEIAFSATLDGHEVDAILDTGAAHTTISREMAQSTFGIDLDARSVERVSGEGHEAVYRTHFHSLAAGDLAVKNPQIYLVPDPVAHEQMAKAMDSGFSGAVDFRNSKLVLGMDVLSQLHFYIAYGEQKLYFTAAVPAAEPSQAR